VILENGQAIEFLLQLESLGAVLFRLLKQVFDPLYVRRFKPFFFRWFRAISFILCRSGLLSIIPFDLRQKLAELALHCLRLFGKLGEVELDTGYGAEDFQYRERRFWKRKLAE